MVVVDSSAPPSPSVIVSAVQQPQIVLAALVRLRWLAVVGQVTATCVAAAVLGLHLPLGPIAALILVTLLSNAALAWGRRRLGKPKGWLIQGVLLLDVVLLTSLLYLTGGPQNPFSALYLVHVAMAVIVLGAAWTWAVVATVSACYGAILRWNLPLTPGRPLPGWERATGNWVALVLVSVLIAAFIGRLVRTLRQREYELGAARDRAARNERLAALTTLAAGAAHELNTPLGTIAVVARELERSCNGGSSSAPAGGPGTAIGEDARLIRQEVERCRTILNRMRVNIGATAANGAVVRLNELEGRLREVLREEDLSRLTIRCDPEARTALAAPRALEHALLVLLRNAFDASAPGQPVALDITRHGGRVRLEVNDRGCGMSEDLLRRAGQPFFTTKGPGKGMGLGLFLVNLVAEQCGASFSMDSRPGAGTRCVLELADGGTRDA